MSGSRPPHSRFIYADLLIATNLDNGYFPNDVKAMFDFLDELMIYDIKRENLAYRDAPTEAFASTPVVAVCTIFPGEIS